MWFLVEGQIGVNIFFVISGFLITGLLLKEKSATGSISLSRFYARRFLRIVPVAYLYLGVLIVLNAVFLLHITPLSFLTGFLYLKNLEFLHAQEWQTGHLWSLAVEEQFYLIFPFILKYNYKLYLRIVIVLLLFLPILNGYGHHHPDNIPAVLLQNLFGRGTAYILWGSLCAILLFKGMIPQAWLVRYKSLGIVALICALVIGFRGPGYYPGKEVLELYLFGPCACVMLLLSMQPGTFLFSFLNHPWVRKIGVLSYSLYVWQQLFTAEQPWGGPLWLNLLAMCAIAWLSYHFYEKRFLRLKERFEPPMKAAQSMAL